MDSPEQAVRLRLSPLGYLAVIAAGFLLVALVGLLIAQLAILGDSREHIQAQDHKIATMQGEGEKALRDARPTISQVDPLLRRARRLLTPAGASLESLTAATDQVPRLVVGIDLVLDEAIPLLQALNAADAPGAIASVGRLTDALAEGERLVRTVDETNQMLAELDRTQLIPRTSEAIPRFEDLLRRLTRIQKRTLRVQIRSFYTQNRQLRVQFQTLGVQREALEHIRSIDRKTGPAPPTTTAVP
jgi:hypothetical protein